MWKKLKRHVEDRWLGIHRLRWTSTYIVYHDSKTNTEVFVPYMTTIAREIQKGHVALAVEYRSTCLDCGFEQIRRQYFP